MTEARKAVASCALSFNGGEDTDFSLEKILKQGKIGGSYWLHLDVEDEEHTSWLRLHTGLDELTLDALLAKKVRPRLVVHSDWALIILRVPDMLKASDYEELRSIRVYTDGKRIISTSIVSLPLVTQLKQRWETAHLKPEKIVDFFMDMLILAARGLEAVVEDLEEETDAYEKQVLDVGEDPDEREVAALALDGLQLRRYLAPQRDVLARLEEAELSWLSAARRKRVREIFERLSRQLDEVEVIRERTRIIKEQINAHVADQVNQRLYVFSVIAVIFVPLGFFTGLLGVNLGGIPGAESGQAFTIFCGLLGLCVVLMVAIFRRAGWL